MNAIKSQRQYDLAKRDGDRITEQIAQLSKRFDTEIVELEMQIAAKTAARDQATAFLREQRDEIAKAMGEWESSKVETSGQAPLVAVGELDA